jgi:glycosyltransferase involved in cell wall biosynthesis
MPKLDQRQIDSLQALIHKDIAGLAGNIAALLENSSLRHHMGKAGRERVEKYFDLRKQCAKLESIYAKLS